MDSGSIRRRDAWRTRALLSAAAVAAGGVLLVSSPSALTGLGLRPSGQPVAAQGKGQTNDNCVAPSNGNGDCLATFGVKVGEASGLLYPTVRQTVPVTWTNPNSFDILVDSYTVTASTKQEGCSSSWLQLPKPVTLTGNSRIPVPAKNGTVATTVPLTLFNNASDACAGATFALTVSATGVKK